MIRPAVARRLPARLTRRCTIAAVLAAVACHGSPQAAEPIGVRETDVVVYGATAAGLTAAIQARRMDASVVVVEASPHVGGMTTGGLSSSDVGNSGAIGGLSSEFYARVGRAYGKQERIFHFEPKVAAAVLAAWLEEAVVEVVTGEPLDLERGVGTEGRPDRVVCHRIGPAVSGPRVHRRQLRGRPDGEGRRAVHGRPRA